MTHITRTIDGHTVTVTGPDAEALMRRLGQVRLNRQLLRQVLDYVEAGQPGHIADKINVLTALRAALEQPWQEPIGWYWEYNGLPEGQVFFGKGPDQDVIARGMSAEFPRIVRYVYAGPQPVTEKRSD